MAEADVIYDNVAPVFFGNLPRGEYVDDGGSIGTEVTRCEKMGG
jgi:hypothetical protein